MYPSTINDLIESFKFLPGIGSKTAQRLAFSILDLDKDQVDFFVSSLNNSINNIHRCPVCNNITDLDLCSVCSNKLRNSNLLCVVDDPKTVFLFEKIGKFDGYYHVLNGLIDPINGITVDDIGLNQLVNRINDSNFKEIVFAFKPCIEGETTSLYIKKILENRNIIFSKLANGVPIGADMEYVDNLTLETAILNRKFI